MTQLCTVNDVFFGTEMVYIWMYTRVINMNINF